jgi:hypothetical protein
MNSFIKQNKLFIAVNTISAILFFVLLYLSIDFSSQSDELYKKAENTIQELSSINSDLKELRHIVSDYNEVQSDLKELSSNEKDLTNFLSYLFNENENVGSKWSSKSAESVNAAITRLFSRLRKKCKNSFISLPQSSTETQNSNLFQSPNTNKSEDLFGFSFSSYDGFWPSFSASEARKLGTQSEIINELIDHLSLCTDTNHSIEIISIKREVVGQIDKENIGNDVLELTDIEPLLIRSLDEIESYVFKLSIKTQTIPLRKLVNKLRPPFLLREILINPVEDNSGNTFDQNSFSPDPFSTEVTYEDKFVPIVSKVDSRVDVIFEYITKANRNLTNSFYLLSEHESPRPQVLFNWLDQSGHESFVPEAKKYFNDENNR